MRVCGRRAAAGRLRLIEGAYLVRNDSPLKRTEDVDASGVRVAVGRGSALSGFIEEMKASGFVADALKRHGIEGATVAARAGT